jgi:hypothetical protein
MFTSAVLMLGLAAANAAPPSHTSTPPHRISAAGPHHPSVHFSTGTLAQVCTNASWLDRLGNLDDASTLFDTISEGGTDATPKKYQSGGRLMRLPDGTYVSLRPNAGGGTSPAVEINIPGYTDGQIKFHFTSR